jgi:allene oxide cyclase
LILGTLYSIYLSIITDSPASSMASTSSLKLISSLKLSNPGSQSRFQSQQQLGFTHSQAFAIQHLKLSKATHDQDHFSTKRSSKGFTTRAFFFNKKPRSPPVSPKLSKLNYFNNIIRFKNNDLAYIT